MKRITTFMLLSLLLLAGMLRAQSTSTIKINPLSLGVLTLNLQGEHAFGERISAQLGFYYGGFKLGGGIADVGSAKIAYNWLGATAEFRYFAYTPDVAPNGLYIAPFLRFQNVNANVDVAYTYVDGNGATQSDQGHVAGHLPAFGGGAVVGYQWIIGKHFVWDTYLGPSVYGGKWALDIDIPESANYTLPTFRNGFSGFALRFGTSIGVAF